MRLRDWNVEANNVLDPYVPTTQAQPAVKAIQANGEFNASTMARINHRNALAIFPKVAEVLGVK